MNDDPLFEREKRWLLNEKYNGVESDDYLNDLEQLKSGTPVDYLIGHREFLGCQIDLSHRPLIPRNETEYWTKQVINHVEATPLHVLDIFAGSGCIGIALLKHLPDCTIDFIEKNPQFVKQIQKNLALNNIKPSRYTIYQSNMFQNQELDSCIYDVIMANPPYIAHDRTGTVQKSVHDYEDHDSLYADDDGLYFVKKLIDVLPNRLDPSGSCYIEYDSWQTELIVNYLVTTHPHLSHHIIKDQFEKNRVLVLS